MSVPDPLPAGHPLECEIVPISSRACERGTKSCIVIHGSPLPAGHPQEPLTADEWDVVFDALVTEEGLARDAVDAWRSRPREARYQCEADEVARVKKKLQAVLVSGVQLPPDPLPAGYTDVLRTIAELSMLAVSDPHAPIDKYRKTLTKICNLALHALDPVAAPGFAQCPECGNLAMNPLPSCATCGSGEAAPLPAGHPETDDVERVARIARLHETLWPTQSSRCAEPLDIDDARWLMNQVKLFQLAPIWLKLKGRQ